MYLVRFPWFVEPGVEQGDLSPWLAPASKPMGALAELHRYLRLDCCSTCRALLWTSWLWLSTWILACIFCSSSD